MMLADMIKKEIIAPKKEVIEEAKKKKPIAEKCVHDPCELSHKELLKIALAGMEQSNPRMFEKIKRMD